MMSFLFDYGLFLAKALTVALCILLVVAAAAAGKRRHGDDDDKMVIRSLNEHYEQQRERLNAELLDKKNAESATQGAEKSGKTRG